MEKNLDVSIYRLSGVQGLSQKEYSTTFIYEPPDQESKSLRGTLFAVLDFSSFGSLDLPLASKLVLDVLSEAYYADKEGSPLKALEKALLECKHRLVNVAFGSQQPSGTQVDFNIVAAVLWGTVVYLAKIGAVASYLLRKEQITEIGPQEESNISIASGIVKAGDTLILGSKAFRESYPPQNLKGALPALKKAAQELSFEKALQESEEIKVKNAYPLSVSLILLEFQLQDVPGKEEVLQIYDVETSQKGISPKLILGKIRLFSWRLWAAAGRGNFKDSLREIMRKLKFKEPSIYIRREEEKVAPLGRAPSKFFILAIAGLILVFTLSVAFTISRRRERAHSTQVAQLMEKAKQDLAKAQDFVDLNNLRSREHLEEALGAIEEALRLAPKSLPELEQLQEEALTLQDRVNKITRLREPDLFYDFTIQSRAAEPVSLTGGGGSIFVADRGERVIYRLRGEEAVPKVEKASFDPVEAPRGVVSGAGRLFVLQDNGLSLLNLGDGSLTPANLALAEAWQDIVSFDIYLDSLYFLSKSSDQIYRTTVSGDSFLAPIKWLEEEANFEDVVSMSIDGDIYVLKRISGEILKFSRGRAADFKLQELDTPLKEPRALFTAPDSNFLYILDSGNKRIIIVSKEGGLYQQQFVYAAQEQAWNDLKSLWVDEESTVIYVLAGTRVYRVDY